MGEAEAGTPLAVRRVHRPKTLCQGAAAGFGGCRMKTG